jgi:hypothetical protein
LGKKYTSLDIFNPETRYLFYSQIIPVGEEKAKLDQKLFKYIKDGGKVKPIATSHVRLQEYCSNRGLLCSNADAFSFLEEKLKSNLDKRNNIIRRVKNEESANTILNSWSIYYNYFMYLGARAKVDWSKFI